MSDELRRLSTFERWLMPSAGASDSTSSGSGSHRSGIIIRTNFAAKAAAAFFERSEDCVNDEVVCRFCGVSYKNWKGENPASVHRTISPKCPALNPSSASGISSSVCDNNMLHLSREALQQNPYRKYLDICRDSEIVHMLKPVTEGNLAAPCYFTTPEKEWSIEKVVAKPVQRQLFPVQVQQSSNHHECNNSASSISDVNEALDGSNRTTYDQATVHCYPSLASTQELPVRSILDEPLIKHPFLPKFGDYDNLFASHRMKTFPGAVNSDNLSKLWAEEGFVYRDEEKDLVCVFCGVIVHEFGHQPSVVHESKNASCPFVRKFDVGNISIADEGQIKNKYFEQNKNITEKDHVNLAHKYGSQYGNEEERLGTFQTWPKAIAKVFPPELMASAGFVYSGGSDTVLCYSCGVKLYDWDEENAKFSPTCTHVLNNKGPDFVTKAALAKANVQVVQYKGGATSKDGIKGKDPGSPNLDMVAVKAAFACGYTRVEIQHAIVKFFRTSSRYPNKAILKASLKAADENNSLICKQQNLVQQKDGQLKKLGIVVEELGSLIYQQGTELQEKDETVQSVQQQLIMKTRQLSQKDVQLSQKDAQLNVERQQHMVQLDQKDSAIRMQNDQIQTLLQQVQQLAAIHRHNDIGHNGPAVEANEDVYQALACKICLDDKPRMVFLPCGHLFSCAECTSQLPERRCPVCRVSITNTIPGFVA